MLVQGPVVRYEDHFGSDLKVANMARVSFGKRSDWDYYCGCGSKEGEGCGAERPYCSFLRPRLKPADEKLIRFLARGMTTDDLDKLVYDLQSEDDHPAILDLIKRYRSTPIHWTPFGHCAATFHITAPIFVARQLGKHQVGFVWNEVSRRYVDSEPAFHEPEVWRKRAENKKQGSLEEPVTKTVKWYEYGNDYETKVDMAGLYDDVARSCLGAYHQMIKAGVCPEQARMILPQSMMTEWFWTGSLYAWASMCRARLDPHTQLETSLVAEQIDRKMAELFPVSWQALKDYGT